LVVHCWHPMIKTPHSEILLSAVPEMAPENRHTLGECAR
jgi:hypothetical protein